MLFRICRSTIVHLVVVTFALVSTAHSENPPEKLLPWLGPQSWVRDTEGPILGLGEQGEFDDTHIFAPAVIHEDGRYLLWYCGSRGAVSERVFRLGLATSENGRDFTKHTDSPVFDFGDGNHSVLTPTLLRANDGMPM